jgi:sulfur carrier protein ThiS
VQTTNIWYEITGLTHDGDTVIMAKVQVKITPSLAGALNASGAEWLILEREIAERSTIGDLFTDIAFTDAEFRQVVFEPNTGKINDLVVVILNDKLLHDVRIPESTLNDGDIVILLPVYMGG